MTNEIIRKASGQTIGGNLGHQLASAVVEPISRLFFDCRTGWGQIAQRGGFDITDGGFLAIGRLRDFAPGGIVFECDDIALAIHHQALGRHQRKNYG